MCQEHQDRAGAGDGGTTVWLYAEDSGRIAVITRPTIPVRRARMTMPIRSAVNCTPRWGVRPPTERASPTPASSAKSAAE